MINYTAMINEGFDSNKSDKEIAAEVSQAMFENQYGSIICSLKAGKRETKKRIEAANEFAWTMVRMQRKVYAMGIR